MTIHIDKYVFRLDISEDNIAFVHILETKQDLREVELDLLL